jgi:hypothetical protein
MELERKLGEPWELKQARESIERWRRERSKLGPMPASVWDVAGRAALSLGVGRVAQALSLNYAALKRRTPPEHKRGERTTSRPRLARFVELSNVGHPRPAGEGVVEVVAPDGMRLIIHRVGSIPDAGALINAFRERR